MISFLIVNRNGGEVFKRCISSITDNCSRLKLKDYEIIVVDNASTEDIKWLEETKNTTVIRNKVNDFFSVPTNKTVKISRGEILFILNNDVILEEGCLENLLTEITKPGIDAVVPVLHYPDGRIQQSITGIPTWKDILWSALGLHIFLPKMDKWRLRKYDYSIKHLIKDQPMFAALMMKRNTWDKVGELDPNLPLLWNDVDWFYKFHRKNLSCWLIPNAIATHIHGMSVNKNFFRKHWRLSRGCYYFLTKRYTKHGAFFRYAILLLCGITFLERVAIDAAGRLVRHS
jgi:hypothetical protein